MRVVRPGSETSARVRWNCRELVRRGFRVAFSTPPPEGGPMVEEGVVYQSESDLPWT